MDNVLDPPAARRAERLLALLRGILKGRAVALHECGKQAPLTSFGEGERLACADGKVTEFHNPPRHHEIGVGERTIKMVVHGHRPAGIIGNDSDIQR